MIALSNSVHLFARPDTREKLTWFFTAVLGCPVIVSGDAPGLPEGVLAFPFPHGGSVSVEFTDDALDERQARRGAWLEVQADDPAALQTKVLEAGLSRVAYPGNDFFYVAAPGGSREPHATPARTR